MTAQTPVPATPEISLVEAVWRYRLMSLIIVLASVLASVAATQIMFSSVTATARFAVTDPTNNNNVLRMGVVSGQGYATYTAQRAAFAGSAPVLARAAQIVKEKSGPALTGEQLRGRVKTSSKPDGGVVIVTAGGGDMAEAAAIANSVLQAYKEVTVSTNVTKLDEQIKNIQGMERKVTQDLELTPNAGSRTYRTLAAQLTKLQTEESGLLSARSKTNDGLQFLDTADPTAASGSKLPQNAVIGLAIGLIVACVVSFLRASAPGRRTRPAGAFGAPVEGGPLGGGPVNGGPVNGGLPGSGPIPELLSGRSSAVGGRHSEESARAAEQAPPPNERPRGARRARGRQAPPPTDRSGRVWTSEEVHGLAATATSPASATTALPATPPPVDIDHDLKGLNGVNGSRGRPTGRANGAAPRGKSPSPSQSPGAQGTPGSRGKGSHAKGRPDKLADDDKPSPVEPLIDPFAEGGDPTRTAEDIGRAAKRAKPAPGRRAPDKGSGKGTGDSSLMHYDLDR
ncbi:hypothetical protein [Actinomadura xylanilytica]|uniref:hypothetical protein n=1 Tax=Actinomadura xylanilytica TaxID=887459 RepID=UPI00255B32DA|nr:hypothetical protein [Actinomadura xylanilytica]MDL4772331.1 hypothetical protein [Actinomadura xylanilytica]